jgi:transcription termination factor Rho
MLDMIPEEERTETIIEKLSKTKDNQEFLDSLKTA